MNARQSVAVLSCVAGISLLGCRHSPPGGSEMYELAAALTKLSAAAEALVRYGDAPEGLDDAQLLLRATASDPALLAHFQGYLLRVSRDDRHAVLLVCDKAGRQGLLEDAGCTAAMDRHLWKENPAKPCAASLLARAVCESSEHSMSSLGASGPE